MMQEWLVKFRMIKSERRKFQILDNISGVIPPNRICLLLGPPGSGKSTLLQALAGKMQHSSSLKVPNPTNLSLPLTLAFFRDAESAPSEILSCQLEPISLPDCGS